MLLHQPQDPAGTRKGRVWGAVVGVGGKGGRDEPPPGPALQPEKSLNVQEALACAVSSVSSAQTKPLGRRELHIPSPSKRLSSAQAQSPASSNAGRPGLSSAGQSSSHRQMAWNGWPGSMGEVRGRASVLCINPPDNPAVGVFIRSPLPFTSQLLGQIRSTNVWGGERR